MDIEEKIIPDPENCMCKGLEVRVYFTCSRKSKEESVATMEKVRGMVVGDKVREVAGNSQNM